MRTLKRWTTWTREQSIIEGSMQKKCERQKGRTFLYSQPQMEQTTEFENPPKGGNNLSRSEDLRELHGNSERSQPTETKDDAEARKDYWSIEGDFIYRHHIEPRVQNYVRKEQTFPIPLKHIDVTRATYTNLDVLQERRIDDYCANFRLRCDTIDERGGSTQRHDDVDKCANDLRHEMALEIWIVSVHEKSEQL